MFRFLLGRLGFSSSTREVDENINNPDVIIQWMAVIACREEKHLIVRRGFKGWWSLFREYQIIIPVYEQEVHIGSIRLRLVQELGKGPRFSIYPSGWHRQPIYHREGFVIVLPIHPNERQVRDLHEQIILLKLGIMEAERQRIR